MFVISYVPSIGILDFKFIRMCLNVCYIVSSLYWDSRFYVHLNLLNVCYIVCSLYWDSRYIVYYSVSWGAFAALIVWRLDFNYLCKQCLSPLMLWVRLPFRARCTTLCDKVSHWLATGRWFSPDNPVSSTNKTDRHDIKEIVLKVALNIIQHTNIIQLPVFIKIVH